MTFTLPDDVACALLKRVPARDRSRYVSEAIAAKLDERRQRLIRACDAANADADVLAIEREWDALDDPIEEPWVSAPSR
ncbi:MAG TPA: hypothetical protein VKX45_07385 [Bryobacteraceae bacterium]|nr:hypothetical protein [Bryobacteraceae bacterium]